MDKRAELSSLAHSPPSEAELVHMLYDAVMDNSLWPEMISELMEYIERARASSLDADGHQFEGLVKHFQRAMKLSESFVELQEKHSTLDGVMNALALGVSVYDHAGKRIYANAAAKQGVLGHSSLMQLRRSAETRQAEPIGQELLPVLLNIAGQEIALVSASAVQPRMLPANVAYVALALPESPTYTLETIQRRFYLSSSEMKLLEAFYEWRNLREAAGNCGLTYESARTYLKRIYSKTGVNDQARLMALFDVNPVSLISGDVQVRAPQIDVRNTLTLKDGRLLEYFALGPEDGHTVLHFDALTGVTVDLIGAPQVYDEMLRDLGLRIIVPCRPGTFRSDFKRLSGLTGFTPDILELLDRFGADKATLLSQAFGSCSALAFAASAPDRVERVVLCAPSYPRHEPANWRSKDVFYIISGVIGRRAPALMKAIIPYLMRSVTQNTSKYLERHIARSNCAADIAVLSSPTLQKRIPEMLALRSMNGTDGLVQENFLNTHGWDFDLGAIAAPVHILQGALDNVSDPVGSVKLAGALPNARLHLFSELGQYLLFSEWPWIFELCAGGAPAELSTASEVPSQHLDDRVSSTTV